MELQETTLHSETIYDGKILHIRQDTVLLPQRQGGHPGGGGPPRRGVRAGTGPGQ